MHGRFSKFEPDNTQMTGVYLQCTYTYSRSQITSDNISSSYNNHYTDTNIQKTDNEINQFTSLNTSRARGCSQTLKQKARLSTRQFKGETESELYNHFMKTKC